MQLHAKGFLTISFKKKQPELIFYCSAMTLDNDKSFKVNCLRISDLTNLLFTVKTFKKTDM